jgi:hypothetical protein
MKRMRWRHGASSSSTGTVPAAQDPRLAVKLRPAPDGDGRCGRSQRRNFSRPADPLSDVGCMVGPAGVYGAGIREQRLGASGNNKADPHAVVQDAAVDQGHDDIEQAPLRVADRFAQGDEPAAFMDF